MVFVSRWTGHHPGAGLLANNERYMFLPLRLMKRAVLTFGAGPVMGTITHAATEERLAALTFDDGPHPIYTPRLLDVLKAHNARASFFTVGASLTAHLPIVARAIAEGHSVCCHGWSHRSFPTMGHQGRCYELHQWREAASGWGSNCFRPPYGHLNIAGRVDCLLSGYKVVTWDVAVEDWRVQTAGELFNRMDGALHPGCIVLLHDAISLTGEVQPGDDLMQDRGPVIEAVDHLLQTRSDYRFVTVDELLRCAQPVYRNWYRFSQNVA